MEIGGDGLLLSVISHYSASQWQWCWLMLQEYPRIILSFPGENADIVDHYNSWDVLDLPKRILHEYKCGLHGQENLQGPKSKRRWSPLPELLVHTLTIMLP